MHTPDLSSSILPGITRDSIIQIAQDIGYPVVQKPLIRTDLYLADEVFMTGTAVEVTPVRSVDDHEIGVGPVTLELQAAYTDTVEGRSERWAQWLDYAPAPKPASPAGSLPRGAGRRPSAPSRSAGRARARTAAPTRRRRRPGTSAKTGWRCIGFQSGRDSTSSASSARRMRSRSVPASSGSTTMHVSQQLLSPYGASGMNEIPGVSASSSR